MSIKLTLVAKRYNSEKMVLTLTNMFLKYGLLRRWQVSFKDLRGRHYDYYFVTKPTRKQIRKLIKDIK